MTLIELPEHALRAARDGRLSVLLLPIEPQPRSDVTAFIPDGAHWRPCLVFGSYASIQSPYKPGDVLGVQEEWCDIDYPTEETIYAIDGRLTFLNWSPPSEIPEHAVRTWLTVVAVTPVLAQDVRLGDVIGCGVWDMNWAVDHTINQKHSNWMSEFLRLMGETYPSLGDNPWLWKIDLHQPAQQRGH